MSNVPAGWYESTEHPGHLQWWDGNSWGPIAPPSSAVSYTATYMPLKSKGVAYLLLLLLGGLGAHRFYLGHVGRGICYVLLLFGSFVWIAETIDQVDVPPLPALLLGILILIELFVLAGSVDRANRLILEAG